jgi:peroxiredoxin Q/BCP
MKLNVGDYAPDFKLPATHSRTVQLSDFRGKNVVLVFFPQAWTPI